MKKVKIIISAVFLITFAMLTTTPVNAQLRTDSNTVTTKIGSPVTSNSALAAVAIELATTIKSACNGAVTSGNISCMQGLSLPNVPHPDVAVSEIVRSATSNLCDDNDPSLGQCLQCVGFVQGAVGGTVGSYLDKGGNAKDFATNVPTGYQYIPISSGTDPQEGDIIIKTGSGFGHIAIVTTIYDSSLIQVAEANFNLGGQVGLNNTVAFLWSGLLRKL